MTEFSTGQPFRPEIPDAEQALYPGGSFEAFCGRINETAGPVYDRLAEGTDIDPALIHRWQLCGTTSRELHDSLQQDAGIETEFKGFPWRYWMAHYHLLTTQTPQPVVVDPTWQQFVRDPYPHPRAPRVLIVPRAQILPALIALNVPSDRFKFWLEASTVARPQAR